MASESEVADIEAALTWLWSNFTVGPREIFTDFGTLRTIYWAEGRVREWLLFVREEVMGGYRYGNPTRLPI
jgi:hypothetical protein